MGILTLSALLSTLKIPVNGYYFCLEEKYNVEENGSCSFGSRFG